MSTATKDRMPKIDPKVLQEKMREIARDVRNGCRSVSADDLEREIFGNRPPKKADAEEVPQRGTRR